MTSRIQFDLSNLSRQQLALIAGAFALVIGAVALLFVVLGSPSGDAPTEETAERSPSPTSEPTVSPSPTTFSTLEPEAPTAGPTPTLEPYSHVVQDGETLGFIIQLFGYTSLDIIDEVLRLNGLASDVSIQVGQELLIPRQTPTPGPSATATRPITGGAGGGAASTQDPTGCSFDNRCPSLDGSYWIHEVSEGETVAGIAFAYEVRLQDVLQSNFSPSDEFISPGEILYIQILVTLTPTLTPTGGPDSTATPTPTLSPPSLLAPYEGQQVGRNEDVILQWVAVRPLEPGQHYLVVLVNAATDEEFRATTRSNIYRLPDDLRPGPTQSIDYRWQVVIIDGDDPSDVVISGQNPAWTFTWGN
ncbi:MAG: LysM peptidoglycan-binding domain-containing protein [Chloroflexi bacterium]|nr:LysM peptidoglycan-binding domain-containing protein [Chloroflexota bacterium]